MAQRWRWLLGVAMAAVMLAACGGAGAGAQETFSGVVSASPERGDWVSVASFGGAGDGRTINTAAFSGAVASIERRRAPGGALLYVPQGVWLTGPFNLTSHMTLFLARGAVIRATQDTSSWPLVDPLPSYGRGRELPGRRYTSLIHGDGLEDVVITGENGTIDGQGSVWWDMWKKRTLRFTRPHLLELRAVTMQWHQPSFNPTWQIQAKSRSVATALMNSSDAVVSNLVFRDSPFWNIHPVYCSNVVLRNLTILAPHDSPNTDGIDADSSSNVCIEDCYISTGDDLIAIKSGWDEYGIAYGRRSSNITVRRITGSSAFAGFAVGSETSGGVENVLAEHLSFFNSGYGIHIKTNSGRGGFVRNITVSGVTLDNVRTGLRIAGDAGGHPDDRYIRSALPVVDALTIKNVRGWNIREAGLIKGIINAEFSRICLSNVKLNGSAPVRGWKC